MNTNLTYLQTTQMSKLTKREIEILTLVSEGKFSQEVADSLCVQKCTVDFHLMNIYAKLEVKNRLEAIIRASQLGLIAAL